MKKLDYIIIVALLILSFTPYVIGSLFQPSGGTLYAEVYMDNNLMDRIRIDDPKNMNTPFHYHNDKGHNTIIIKDTGVEVFEADCPDQICVKSKPIISANRVIACLPNNFLVKIVSSEEDSTSDDGVDFISE